MVPNIRRLRNIAINEPDKEIHIRYAGDMDPSGDDMDRDLLERIKSVNAKLNIDEFIATEFLTYTDEEKKEVKSKIKGEKVLAELIKDDSRFDRLNKALKDATREDKYKDPLTGVMIDGRNSILDKIRILKSQVIAYHYPKNFPHLVPMTKEQEDEEMRLNGQIELPRGQKIIHFERIAVTPQQIKDLKLPEMPVDEKTLAKLKNDPRAPRMEKKYGKIIAVEVDALNAKHPDVLKALVEKTVDDLYDEKIYKDEILKPYGSKEYKKEINQKTIEKLKALATELEAKSDDDFKNEWEDENKNADTSAGTDAE